MYKDENQLYYDQMMEWFSEHKRIENQLEQTINYHYDLARSNQKQLELHKERLEMAKIEFNIWARDHGFPTIGED